jgi:ATP synthase I chain
VTNADYERALARLPNWMVVLGVIGTGFAAHYAGLSGAAGFLLGSVAAWLNLRMIERGVNRIVRLTAAEPGTVTKGSGVRLFIQFFIFVALAFVILRFTGFNLMAAMLGFLVCPAAAILEMVYELFTYGHS